MFQISAERTFPHTEDFMEPSDLNSYLAGGVVRIVKDALRAVFDNPEESAFVAGFAAASRKAAALRQSHASSGEHVPPFLIASITDSCNLHCAGCYARENRICTDGGPNGTGSCGTGNCGGGDRFGGKTPLTAETWERLFIEAESLGVGFILLAGGEPLLRRDVLERAAGRPSVLFPVFTNGTLIDASYAAFFARNRNLVPVLSIEGGKETTDRRRGSGTYGALSAAMELLAAEKILFGASVTVTAANMEEVTSAEFLERLQCNGCRLVVYVEYVPVSANTDNLALNGGQRAALERHVARLRAERAAMIFISFPGDEHSSGGCLAAGRGFFHVNPYGGAEPCPFSPYSDTDVTETGIRGALKSPLFTGLRESGMLLEEHTGGCTLFRKREQVRALADGGAR
ncbi:radical SAM protein [Treponema brennaborense]|nr:radical SAM protein [Treponema brennaborense]